MGGRVFVAVLAVSLVMVVATPVSSQQVPDLSPTPDVIWDVATADTTSRHTRPLRALVRDMEEFDGHMYVAGKFLDVAAPDGRMQRQPYLARFDLESGEWDSSYRPDVPDIVYAIEITPDGRMYLGGEMDGGVLLYDARSGARISDFRPRITNSWGPPAVFDLQVVGDDLYLGGDFTESQGFALENLAKVDTTTGSIDAGWRPTADFDTDTPDRADSLVFALSIDTELDRIYLAGKFGGINGDDRASYFAVVRPSDGSLVPGLRQGLPNGIPNHRNAYSMWMEDVQFDGDRLYLGGNGHQTITMRRSDLGLLASHFTHRGVDGLSSGGDTQVIAIGETTVWSGCHCFGNVGPFEIGSYINGADGVMVEAEYTRWVEDFATRNPFGQQPVRGGFGLDRSTGELLPFTFDLRGQAGAYAIVEDSNGRLWMGGQFTEVASTGRPISGMVRFSTVGNGPGPEQEPPPLAVPPADDARPADDQILRLYRAAFGRSPDPGGFSFWSDAYRSGRSLESIAAGFESSPEWRARFGADPSASAFVDALYRNVLGRSGDAGGERFWVEALTSGRRTRAEVVVGFADSAENIRATGTSDPLTSAEARVLRLYRAAFGRTPDTAGFSFWVDAHRNSRSLDSIAAAFVASVEWRERFGADPAAPALVDGLYRNVLGRPADASGRAFWIDQLDQRSVALVLVAFSESPENLERTGTAP